MNNFIVGQVTPDMLSAMPYGTYILFGLLTYTGAGSIWLFVPETRRLMLEEMDIIFRSEDTAQADRERMDGINAEIGLTQMLWEGLKGARSAVGEVEKGGDWRAY